MATSIHTSVPEKSVAITPAAPGGSRPARARSSGSSSSRSTLPRPHPGRLVRLGVVVAEHVEHAVHHEQRQLVVEGAGVARAPGRRPRSGRSRRRRAGAAGRPGSGGGRSGPRRCGPDPSSTSTSSPSIGKASTSVGPGWPRNSSLSSAMSVSLTNSRLQLRVAPHALGRQHALGQARPSGRCRPGRRPARRRTKTSSSPSPPSAGAPAQVGTGRVTHRAWSPAVTGGHRLVVGLLVGGDDVGHDLVAHDVGLGRGGRTPARRCR